ncbi:MAG: ATP-dependent helicase, partial [Candidatus Omnitrophica bacterium]|nr:ATP-dependent helicase [Candidatus Omnitrophota bacterium]
MPDILTSLNEEQKKAVETTDGPVLIIAGPGTGKTQLLSARTANIMRKKHIPGENILILTYTNAAAKSVKERLAKLIGFDGYKISVDTFHGFANSIILDSEEAAFYIRERIQMTELEKVKSLEYILDNFTEHIKNLRPFGYPYLYVSEISNRISELKNEGISPGEFEKATRDIRPDGVYVENKHVARLRELAFIYGKYEDLKTGADKNVFDRRGRYDYDDMIMLAIATLRNEPELKEAYRNRYRYIMVDEFQDTNGAQLNLLFLLCDDKRPNLCCVGDDDQSIYRFQGASIANFKILMDRFPDITTVELKKNYRSSKEIIDLFSDIIKYIPGEERLGITKKLIPQKKYKNRRVEFVRLSTEDEEIAYILGRINELRKTIEESADTSQEEKQKPYNQIAIMVRKRIFMLKLIESFLSAGIPYATDGKEDISGQKRVKQMIDALMLAKAGQDTGERDLLLYKFLSFDFFEIPQSDILNLLNYINSIKGKTAANFFTEFLYSFRVDDQGRKPGNEDTQKLGVLDKVRLSRPSKLHIASWVLHRVLVDSGTRPLHDLLMTFVEDSGIYKFITKTYEGSGVLITRELRTLTSFITMVKNMSISRPELTLSAFCEELEMMKNNNMPIEGRLVTATQDGVRIITAHAAKGLEFHTCFIPFCLQDKSWPLKPLPDKLPLPPSIIKTKEKAAKKSDIQRLSFFDETRLFYVASSRAKSNLIFTASPSEDTVASSFFNNISITAKESGKKEIDVLKSVFEKGKEPDLEKETQSALRDLVKNLVLTPTKLNNYLKCKRKFLYDNLLLLPGRKKASLVFGNCTHKALEDAYRMLKKEKKFPDFDFFKESFCNELRFQGVNKKIENACLAKLGDLKKWFDKTKVNPVMPIDLEK